VPSSRLTLDSEGPWDLPVEGFEVLQVTFGYPIFIVAYGPDGASVTIQFEGAFEVVEPGGARRKLDASTDSWEEMSIVLSLRHDHLHSVQAEDSAALAVEFRSGRRIAAGPTAGYENWQVSGRDFSLVSLPGGGVALFGGHET